MHSLGTCLLIILGRSIFQLFKHTQGFGFISLLAVDSSQWDSNLSHVSLWVSVFPSMRYVGNYFKLLVQIIG